MSECVFCEIVAGRARAHRLLEDDHTLAFLNLAPATVGHALVVPRRHAEGLWDLGDEEHARVARAAVLGRQRYGGIRGTRLTLHTEGSQAATKMGGTRWGQLGVN